MSKTLMLVICDFLLLSMLAMARFDKAEADPDSLAAREEAVSREAELVEVLEMSLEEEMAMRVDLKDNLSETRASLEEKSVALDETREALSLTEAEAVRLAKEKVALEQTRSELESAQNRLETERAELAENYESTRQRLSEVDSERVELAKDLGTIKETASVTQERLRRAEEDLARREAELEARAEELARVEADRQRLAGEKEAIVRRLEVAQAERGLLSQNLENERLEKAIVRQEKERALTQAERLGEGVSALAESSEGIRKEIEKSRPLTMSEIFTRFKGNRATLRFESRRRGVFGENESVDVLRSIIVRDGANSYVLAHVADTPFRFTAGGSGLEAVSVEVRLGDASYPVREVGFMAHDPRILFIPLPQSMAAASELKPFELSLEPERFEEAVLVSNDESNFGRTEFRRLTESERFLRVDRPAMGELFADFAASRGDFVFSKSGMLIGLMVDSRHAAVVPGFLASGTARVGSGFDPSATATTLDRLRARLRTLPAAVR